MIPNGEGWNYITVKKTSALLIGITSKHKGNFYCLSWFHSFKTKNKFELLKKVLENNFFCSVEISSGDTKILEFNQYQNPDQVPFIIYADIECLIERTDV